MLRSALAFAFIASAETLLCASAVDRMHRGPRTRFNRELAAQGVGNVICGVFGALPMTGVIVRSAANVEAGARTRLSAVLHGAWLLAFVSLAPGLLRLVPLTSLAPQHPKSLEKVVMRLLAKKAGDRYPTANELASALVGVSSPNARFGTRLRRLFLGS